jgi:hypothetical protein
MMYRICTVTTCTTNKKNLITQGYLTVTKVRIQNNVPVPVPCRVRVLKVLFKIRYRDQKNNLFYMMTNNKGIDDDKINVPVLIYKIVTGTRAGIFWFTNLQVKVHDQRWKSVALIHLIQELALASRSGCKTPQRRFIRSIGFFLS